MQVGIFPKFSGEEYENFLVLADKMRSTHDFGHTSNAKLIAHGDSSVTKPTLRLLKPFDELSVDSKVYMLLYSMFLCMDRFRSVLTKNIHNIHSVFVM